MFLRCMIGFVVVISIGCLAQTVSAQEDSISVVAQTVYPVKEFGAVGDGETEDTKAIQLAINAASEEGGGTVFFHPGNYLSGTLIMESNVTLYLESGATLLGSKDLEKYPRLKPAFRSYTDNYVRQSLIFGENLHDVAIRGKGIIDGQGEAFKQRDYLIRPYIIRMVSCKNVLIEGIKLRNSAMWMQHYLNCGKVTVRGIDVENHVTYNNDGLDIDCCRDVVISDCIIDSDDDALCLKSTADRPTENVVIENCVLSSHCNAIKMGTESNGGFKNVTITNCAIQSPESEKSIYGMRRGISGIALEIVDGGTMNRISISNITMMGVSTPIFLRLGNRARPFKEEMEKPGMGVMKNINLSNIIATDVGTIGCSITGLPNQPVENVSLSNIQITFDGGAEREHATKEVPEKAESYPESKMFGTLPAYGFYCRHVDGLTFNNVDLRWNEDDPRPAIVCDDVQNLQFNGVSGQTMQDGFPMVVLRKVNNALIRGSNLKYDANVFLKVEDGSENINVIGNSLRRAITAFEFGENFDKAELHEASNILY